MNITIELDLDQKFIMRKCYSFLDLLSEVGGMIGILMVFFSSVVSCFNYNNFDNYMVSRLFKVKKIDELTIVFCLLSLSTNFLALLIIDRMFVVLSVSSI